MSLELLFLLIVLLLWPLLRQLLGATRQQDPRPPEWAEGPPLGPPQAPMPAPPQPALAIPPRAKRAAHATADTRPPHGAKPPRETAGKAPSAPAPHRRARRGTSVVVDLDSPADLRRAIVLAAILGPCRAVNPYDWPERAGRQ